MFCSKCGKEIMDEAIMCPYCGCATNNYFGMQKPYNNGYSNNYSPVKAYVEKAKTLQILGIIAGVLMFGIGIIFSIIILIMSVGLKVPQISTTNMDVINEIDAATRKIRISWMCALLPVVGLVLCVIGVTIAVCVM